MGLSPCEPSPIAYIIILLHILTAFGACIDDHVNMCRVYCASWLPGHHHHAESDIMSEQGSRASLLPGRVLQDREDGGRAPKRSKRPTPGFCRQFGWCLSRVALQRTREPLIVVTDYAIFALTGDPCAVRLTLVSSVCAEQAFSRTFIACHSWWTVVLP